jgi:hypothetical protein
MVYLHTKNPRLDIFWRPLEWIMLVYFMNITANIVRTFCKFYVNLVYFMAISYVCILLVYFSTFRCVVPTKIWQPWIWVTDVLFMLCHIWSEMNCRLKGFNPLARNAVSLCGDFFNCATGGGGCNLIKNNLKSILRFIKKLSRGVLSAALP